MSNLYAWPQTPAVSVDWEHVAQHEAGIAVSADPPYGQVATAEVNQRDTAVREQFTALAQQWRDATGDVSSMTKRVLHPTYQRIVGLGQPAVPLLLEELEVRPNYWFHALRAITSVDPVRAEHRGNLREMTAAWLDWGRTQGYLE